MSLCDNQRGLHAISVKTPAVPRQHATGGGFLIFFGFFVSLREARQEMSSMAVLW